MPAKVKCVYCMGVNKVRLTDENDRPTGEWEWWSNCELFGNEEVVGYDCGKGRCYKYTKPTKQIPYAAEQEGGDHADAR